MSPDKHASAPDAADIDTVSGPVGGAVAAEGDAAGVPVGDIDPNDSVTPEPEPERPQAPVGGEVGTEGDEAGVPVGPGDLSAHGGDGRDDDDDLTRFEQELDGDFVALERERDDYLDALRRLQADFENFRKRVQKERVDLGDQAVMALVGSLLPVLDAADLAKAHGGGDGVDQVSGLLYDTLAKAGLEAVDPEEGEPFDPNLHEAVAHDPGDGDEPAVAQVLRAGYRWKGRVLRAAMVKVKG